MNAVLLFIIGIPLIEIYLMIKIGGTIGAFNTIFLIFFTAVTGIYFARLEGLNTIRSGFGQLIRNEIRRNYDAHGPKYLKRLLRRYEEAEDLQERLILNHLIVIYNVFGIPAANKMIWY